jgi:hypothetical protein
VEDEVVYELAADVLTAGDTARLSGNGIVEALGKKVFLADCPRCHQSASPVVMYRIQPNPFDTEETTLAVKFCSMCEKYPGWHDATFSEEEMKEKANAPHVNEA